MLVAKELRYYTDDTNKKIKASSQYTVPEMSVQLYEQMLLSPNLQGEYSAYLQGRTLTDKEQ